MASYNMLNNSSSEILLPMTRSDCITMGDGATFQSKLDNIKTTMCNLVYPVGTVITTYTNTNPSSSFGGTWTNIGANTTLISYGDPYLTRQNDKSAPDTLILDDGSRWDLIFFQSTTGGVVTEATAKDIPFTTGTANYSALKYLPNYFEPNGEIEFLASYNVGTDCLNPTLDPARTGRWRQKGNPTHEIYEVLQAQTAVGLKNTDNIGATSFQQGLYIPWTTNNWGGFTRSADTAYCYIDGNPHVSGWWYAIGAYQWYNNGIPWANVAATSVILYARTDLLELEKCKFVKNVVGANTCTLASHQNGPHAHRMGRQQKSGGSAAWDTGGGNALASEYTKSTGGNGAHNNMQPYITAYYWERTA